MKNFKLISVGLITVVLLSSCSLWNRDNQTNNNNQGDNVSTSKNLVFKVADRDINLKVEIADSPETREKGLMFRENMKEGTGMLFIFPNEGPRAFWMKNTLIPLDLIYFDRNKQVVKIIEYMQPCREAVCQSYYSEVPAMYALEVPAGFVKENTVGLGNKFEFD